MSQCNEDSAITGVVCILCKCKSFFSVNHKINLVSSICSDNVLYLQRQEEEKKKKRGDSGHWNTMETQPQMRYRYFSHISIITRTWEWWGSVCVSSKQRQQSVYVKLRELTTYLTFNEFKYHLNLSRILDWFNSSTNLVTNLHPTFSWTRLGVWRTKILQEIIQNIPTRPYIQLDPAVLSCDLWTNISTYTNSCHAAHAIGLQEADVNVWMNIKTSLYYHKFHVR